MKTFDPFTVCLFCNDPVDNFEPGPIGGATRNMTCRRCGARYNLTFMSRPRFIEIIEGPRDRDTGATPDTD